jgi:hypothetical protein
MFTRLLERFTQELSDEKNIELLELKLITPLVHHIYNRLKKYIIRVLLMYYLIIILLLIIIIFLMKRK